MNNHSNNKDDDIFHPPDDQFKWDNFDSELSNKTTPTHNNKYSKKEQPIIFNQYPQIFSKLSLRVILVLIAIIVNISAVAINSLHKIIDPQKTATSTHETYKATETQIAEAFSWGTSSNPAFLSDATPERLEKTIWPNGNIRSIEPMVNNMIDGIGKYTHENGKIYGHIPYLHGQKHGRFDLYAEDGSLDQSLSYKNGIPHGVLTWHIAKESWIYVNGEAIKKIPYEPIHKSP